MLLLAAAFETFIGERLVPFHLAFQLLGGALLIEIMFWSFDRVPFTCSYFPGHTNLAILAVRYVYGFTAYGVNMADLESALERHLVVSLLCFASAALLLRLSWRRTPQPSAIRFDGDEPIIQTLDLS